MKIFIGLGNPGLKYQNTRHNIGFEVINSIRNKYSPKDVIKTDYCKGWIVSIAGKETVIAKPKTFVNESGVAVKKLYDRFGGSIDDYIVIHDDLDIEVGKIKIVNNKGAGGHNGISSVISELNSKDFFRIRVGIGRDIEETSYINYVLSSFKTEEKPLIEEAIKLATMACEEMVRSSTAKAMTIYNK
jgi:PTH1 family peptidyl-tRNA hydrolase